MISGGLNGMWGYVAAFFSGMLAGLLSNYKDPSHTPWTSKIARMINFARFANYCGIAATAISTITETYKTFRDPDYSHLPLSEKIARTIFMVSSTVIIWKGTSLVAAGCALATGFLAPLCFIFLIAVSILFVWAINKILDRYFSYRYREKEYIKA